MGKLVGMGWPHCIYLGAAVFVFGDLRIAEAIADSNLRARAAALVSLVGTVNIPVIKYSVDWWNTLHQPASFSLTEKPAMPPEMWLPLLVMALGFYCFAAHNVLSRMRLEVLRREGKTRWVNELFAAPAASQSTER